MAAVKLCLLSSMRILWSFVLCLPLPLVSASAFPAMFVFGDSLLDPGNANKVLTLVKANHPPYGRDFVTHQPTGRFCDGLLSTDILASLAGLPLPPAYLLDPNDILQGTSFATSGARIINLTIPLVRRVDFVEQVGYFSDLRLQLIANIGVQETSVLLSKSLFLLCLGSNDYTASDFANRQENSSQQTEMSDELTVRLISAYEGHLLELYNLGARKFALASLSVLGCIPFELFVAQSVNGACVSSINDEAIKFNAALLQLSERLQASISDAHFTYLNTYDILFDVINDPAAYGIIYGSTACCGTGLYRGLPCYNSDVSTVCVNASEYVFWDFAHPTQTVNEILANRFWAGSPPDVMPMNVLQLSGL